MMYIKDNLIIEEAKEFLYEEELYLSFPNRWELYRVKTYSSKEPVSKPNSRAYSEKQGCYIQRFWELIGAPKQYLEDEGFKLKL